MLTTPLKLLFAGAFTWPLRSNGTVLLRGLSLLAPVMDVQPPGDLAHEHGTTRHVRSPAVPENMAFLLVATSALSGLLPSVAFLANLHPVRFITKRRLVTRRRARSRCRPFHSLPL